MIKNKIPDSERLPRRITEPNKNEEVFPDA
jgi:hypothetical protein